MATALVAESDKIAALYHSSDRIYDALLAGNAAADEDSSVGGKAGVLFSFP